MEWVVALQKMQREECIETMCLLSEEDLEELWKIIKV